jgi:hypothetical protein
MQQSIVKFIALSYRHCSSCFRASQCPSSGARQTAVAASGFHMNVEVDVFLAVVGLLANRPRLRTLPSPHCPKHVEQCLYDKAINFTIDCCIQLGFFYLRDRYFCFQIMDTLLPIFLNFTLFYA